MDYFVAPDRWETPDFTLRAYQPGDGPLLNEAVKSSYDHLKIFMEWPKPDEPVEESEKTCRRFSGEYLLSQNFVIGVFNPDGKQQLGGTGYHFAHYHMDSLTAEIGMWIRADQAGHGLGTAVLKEMVKWSFTGWPWLKVTWVCDTKNIASARTAQKAGLFQEGLLRGDTFAIGSQERRDTLMFGLTKPDWEAKNSGK